MCIQSIICTCLPDYCYYRWLSSFSFSRNLRLLSRWECQRRRKVFKLLRSVRTSCSGSIYLPMLTMDSSRRCFMGLDLGCLGGSTLSVAFGIIQFLVSTLLPILLLSSLAASCIFAFAFASASSSLLFFLNFFSRLMSSSRSACSRQKVKSPLSSGISSSNNIPLILLQGKAMQASRSSVNFVVLG